MLELAGEVQETLGKAYGLPDDVDEDDLEAGECSLNCHQPVCLYLSSCLIVFQSWMLWEMIFWLIPRTRPTSMPFQHQTRPLECHRRPERPKHRAESNSTNLDSRNSLIRAPPLTIIIAVIQISMLLLCALYITPVGHVTGPDFNLGMMILVL